MIDYIPAPPGGSRAQNAAGETSLRKGWVSPPFSTFTPTCFIEKRGEKTTGDITSLRKSYVLSKGVCGGVQVPGNQTIGIFYVPGRYLSATRKGRKALRSAGGYRRPLRSPTRKNRTKTRMKRAKRLTTREVQGDALSTTLCAKPTTWPWF